MNDYQIEICIFIEALFKLLKVTLLLQTYKK